MNKAELVAAVAAKAEISQKDAAKALAAILEEIQGALKNGEKVQLVGFGSFEASEKAAGKGRNEYRRLQGCFGSGECQTRSGSGGGRQP